jgi:hypothetical protein
MAMFHNETLHRLAWRFAQLRTVIDTMPHQEDDLDGWRRGWAQAREIVADVDRLSATPPNDR